MRFVIIFGSPETDKVNDHLLPVLNVKAHTEISFPGNIAD